MAGRVYEVDNILIAVLLTLEELERLVCHVVVQRDACRLDGDAALRFVRACVRQPYVAGLQSGAGGERQAESIESVAAVASRSCARQRREDWPNNALASRP